MFAKASLAALLFLLVTARPDDLARELLFGRGLLHGNDKSCIPNLARPKVIRNRKLSAQDNDEAHIFFFNDLHGRISPRAADDASGEYGAVSLAQTIQELRATYPDQSILVSIGDNVGATEYISSTLEEQPTIDVLQILDTRVVALGNHEFDRGYAWLAKHVLEGTRIPHLGANVYWADSCRPAFQSSYIWRLSSGRSIGFVGVVTRSVPLLVRSAGIQELHFGDVVEAANREAALLLDNDHVDAIVLLVHQGPDPNQEDSEEWLSLLMGLDPRYNALLTGHTHTTYHQTKPFLILQAGCYGSHVGHVHMQFKENSDGSVTAVSEGELVDAMKRNPDGSSFANDPVVNDVRRVVREATLKAEGGRRRIIGRTCRAIQRARNSQGEPTRSEESALVHLVADALLATDQNADLAMVNPGSVRADLPQGIVTADQIQSLAPFGNYILSVVLTGALVLAALEQQFQSPRLMLGVANLRYTYEDGGIKDVYIGGNHLDPTKKYRVVINDFLEEGGDGFYALQRGEVAKRHPTMTDRVAIEQYLRGLPTVESEPFERAVDITRLRTQSLKVSLCIQSWTSTVIEIGVQLNTAPDIGNLRIGLIFSIEGEYTFATGIELTEDYVRRRSNFLILEVPNTFPPNSVDGVYLCTFSDVFDYNPFPGGIHTNLTFPYPVCTRGARHGRKAHI